MLTGPAGNAPTGTDKARSILDYEILFHLDTVRVESISAYPNGILSRYDGKDGREYEVALIPLDCASKVPEVKVVSAATEPMYRGWYNGRNENNLHEAVTVSRQVSGVCDYTFTTLIFPVKRGDPLPVVTMDTDGTVRVSCNGTNHVFNLYTPDR